MEATVAAAGAATTAGGPAPGTEEPGPGTAPPEPSPEEVAQATAAAWALAVIASIERHPHARQVLVQIASDSRASGREGPGRGPAALSSNCVGDEAAAAGSVCAG